MRLLIAYSRFPWPTIRGDQLTVFKLLEYLGSRHEVDFLGVSPKRREDFARLPTALARVELVGNPMPRRLARIARALAGNGCLQIASFLPSAFIARREALLRERRYDLVYSHYIRSYGHQRFSSMGAPQVLALQLSHQAHFRKAAQKASNPVTRWLYGIETRRLEAWEGRIAAWNDLVHLISPKDLRAIAGHEQFADRVFFNPHGVDESVFVPAPSKRIPGRVVFTGNLKFQANEDAVVWLCGEIWPRIRAAHPEATLCLAGAMPTAGVRQAVAAVAGASLIPNPPNMWEVIQTGDVAVDPLRIGAGLQNKVLEALACGVPMVATTLANEGIGAEPEKEIVLADAPAAFAAEVVALLKDAARRQALSDAGRAFIERAWSWEHHFGQLEQRWMELSARRQ